ncbi:MAG: enoyl-CoA hydratase [Rhodospirillaceae bacterium]|nr:enoyl-CoA hydratase [Rhodospirillaceae bacterium]
MATIKVDTGTEELLCEIQDRVATITLNRPEVRNALGDNITPALRTTIQEMASDDTVGSLVLTGSGKAFCAGGDVKSMGQSTPPQTQTIDQKINLLKERQRTLTGSLRQVRKPTIASLPGPAAGAGLAIALACDIRIAAESSFVSTGYAAVGLSGDYGISWLLTRLVGTAKAHELMFTADRVTAEECSRIGLVNRVTTDSDLQRETFKLAHKLANGPVIALRHIKENLEDALKENFLSALDNEAERLVQTAQTEDHKEAVRAFIEKRAPVFKGE